MEVRTWLTEEYTLWWRVRSCGNRTPPTRAENPSWYKCSSLARSTSGASHAGIVSHVSPGPKEEKRTAPGAPGKYWRMRSA